MSDSEGIISAFKIFNYRQIGNVGPHEIVIIRNQPCGGFVSYDAAEEYLPLLPGP